MKAKKLKKEGDKLVRTVDSIEDETQALLVRIREADGAAHVISDDVAKALRKRQLIAQVGVVWVECLHAYVQERRLSIFPPSSIISSDRKEVFQGHQRS